MPLTTFLNGRKASTLRGLSFLALSDTAVIQTRSGTADSGGGSTFSYVPSGTVSCRVDPFGAMNSRLVGGAIDERSTHLCTMPPGTSIDLRNRIAVQNRGTFEVTLVRVRTGEQSNVCEVMEIDL